MVGFTRNYNPQYYESHRFYANCGSFAFQIEEWYSFEESFEEDYGEEIEEWVIDNLDNSCCDCCDIADSLAEILSNYILLDFDDVRWVHFPSEVKANEELIAFRTFVGKDGNWDFHFKVYRDNHWQHKCGTSLVKPCEVDDWVNGSIEYNSYTFLFARKIAS